MGGRREGVELATCRLIVYSTLSLCCPGRENFLATPLVGVHNAQD